MEEFSIVRGRRADSEVVITTRPEAVHLFAALASTVRSEAAVAPAPGPSPEAYATLSKQVADLHSSLKAAHEQATESFHRGFEKGSVAQAEELCRLRQEISAAHERGALSVRAQAREEAFLAARAQAALDKAQMEAAFEREHRELLKRMAAEAEATIRSSSLQHGEEVGRIKGELDALQRAVAAASAKSTKARGEEGELEAFDFFQARFKGSVERTHGTPHYMDLHFTHSSGIVACVDAKNWANPVSATDQGRFRSDLRGLVQARKAHMGILWSASGFVGKPALSFEAHQCDAAGAEVGYVALFISASLPVDTIKAIVELGVEASRTLMGKKPDESELSALRQIAFIDQVTSEAVMALTDAARRIYLNCEERERALALVSAGRAPPGPKTPARGVLESLCPDAKRQRTAQKKMA